MQQVVPRIESELAACLAAADFAALNDTSDAVAYHLGRAEAYRLALRAIASGGSALQVRHALFSKALDSAARLVAEPGDRASEGFAFASLDAAGRLAHLVDRAPASGRDLSMIGSGPRGAA
jgi:hypothetical protein